jgi:hypothetical protein
MTNQTLGSRTGSIHMPSAGITPAELDAIEVEVNSDRSKPDKISLIISIASATLLAIKVLKTNDWHKDSLELALLMLAIGLSFVQAYKFITSFKSDKSDHQKNAERYLKNLRSAMAIKFDGANDNSGNDDKGASVAN